MPSLEEVWALLLTSGVTGGAVGSLVVWFGKDFISERMKARIKSEYDVRLATLQSRLKAHSDVEIERLRSQLSIVAAERNIRFSRLHEQRATVIADLYALLSDALVAIADYVRRFEPAGGKPRTDREGKVVDTVNEFTRAFMAKRIFLPASSAQKLDDIRKALRSAHFDFAVGVYGASGPNVGKMAGN